MKCKNCQKEEKSVNVKGKKFNHKHFVDIELKLDCYINFCPDCDIIEPDEQKKIDLAMTESVKKDKRDYALHSITMLILYILVVANLFWMYSLLNPEIQQEIAVFLNNHPNDINLNWQFMRGTLINYILSGATLWFLFYSLILTFKSIKKINVEYQKSWGKK